MESKELVAQLAKVRQEMTKLVEMLDAVPVPATPPAKKAK